MLNKHQPLCQTVTGTLHIRMVCGVHWPALEYDTIPRPSLFLCYWCWQHWLSMTCCQWLL